MKKYAHKNYLKSWVGIGEHTPGGSTWGADKSLVRPERKQAWKHVRDVCNFNNIETRAVIRFFFLQGKMLKESHAILAETLAFFLPLWAKDLSAPLYRKVNSVSVWHLLLPILMIFLKSLNCIYMLFKSYFVFYRYL